MLTTLSKWLGQLSVSRKLTLIYLLDLTAVIYVSGILIHEKFLSIDFTRKEIVGTAYTEVVRRNLMGAFLLTAPQSTAAAWAADDQAPGPLPALPAGDLTADLAALLAVREVHDEALHTVDLAGLFAQTLQEVVAQQGVDAGHKHRLLTQARELLTTVGNQSNLILDPDLDSYYVMSLTVLRFPELLQVLHDTRRFLRESAQQHRSGDRSAQLLTLAGKLDATLQGMEADYQQAGIAGSPALKAALQPSRLALLEQAKVFGAQVQALAGLGAQAGPGPELEAAYLATLVTLNQAWSQGVVQLDGLLEARVSGLFSRMWLHLGTALLLLGCILSLVYLVASQIARPLQALARVADAVRHTADYTRRAQWSSRDEIGQLVTAFNDMLAQLDRDRLVQQELAASARAAVAQQELVEALPVALMVTSVPDHEVLHANAPVQPWLAGCTQDPWRLGLEPAVRARFFQRLADSGAVDEFEVRWRAGSELSWAVLSARRFHYQGRDAVLTAFTPINVIKLMEQRLELWAKVFEASSESIIIMNTAHKIISVNKAFCRSTSHEFYEILGKDLAFLLEGEGPDWTVLSNTESWQGEVRVRRLNGETYPAWLMVSAVREGDGSRAVANYIGISIDITDRKAKEERIAFLAQHDVLTELPNRALCNQRLAEALAQAQRTGEQVAVLFIDLDRFKTINDTLGHHVGDGLLRMVARRLTQAVRAEDTVSRLGGDEFVIIMRHVTSREELEVSVGQRLIPSIRASMVVEGNSLSVSCSVGIALFPDDAQDQEGLMRRADAAMYEAKAQGRDNARFFSPETDQRVLGRQLMEAQLGQALARDEFSLHFQPRLHARERRLAGAEALLRWNNPQLGAVPPGDFIGLAEETGLIKSIGLWVLQEACRQWRAMEAQGLAPGLVLSVNLSGAQLADPLLVAQVAQVLHDTGLPAAQLELELTESHLMENPMAAQAQVAALKALGVQVAIDDFGTGYSSLTYLKRFEINKLKVDQSFVRSMLDDSADAAIVQAVIALGHTLGLLVVAEGVEDLPTAQTLTALGCDELQGYAFSRPVPGPELLLWASGHGATLERRRKR